MSICSFAEKGKIEICVKRKVGLAFYAFSSTKH